MTPIGRLVIAFALFAAVAPAQAAPAADALFHGARLHMSKAELVSLPGFAGRPPNCAPVKVTNPPAKAVELCNAREGVYLLAADREDTPRLIFILVGGEAIGGSDPLAALTGRYGKPARVDDTGGVGSTNWFMAGQQVVLRQPCIFGGRCIEVSDSAFARQVWRAVAPRP